MPAPINISLSVPPCPVAELSPGSSLTSCEAIILRVEFQQVTNETGLCPLEILFDQEHTGRVLFNSLSSFYLSNLSLVTLFYSLQLLLQLLMFQFFLFFVIFL
jgi:hypothetical protein